MKREFSTYAMEMGSSFEINRRINYYNATGCNLSYHRSTSLSKISCRFRREWERVVGRKARNRLERERKEDWWGGLFLGNVIPGYSNLHGKKSKCSTVDEVLFSSLHLEFFHIYTYIGRIESFSSTFFKNILPLLDLFLDRVKRLILLLKNCSYVTKYKLITLLIQFYRYSKE